jgi:hypothetical protein
MAICTIAATATAQGAAPTKLGRWQLDLAHSALAPGPQPVEDIRTYEAAPDGMVRSIHRTVYAGGRIQIVTYTARDDGLPYPMTDGTGAGMGTIALQAHGPRTQTFVTKRDDAITGEGTTTISRDGKTLRMSISVRSGAAGRKMLRMAFRRIDQN